MHMNALRGSCTASSSNLGRVLRDWEVMLFVRDTNQHLSYDCTLQSGQRRLRPKIQVNENKQSTEAGTTIFLARGHAFWTTL